MASLPQSHRVSYDEWLHMPEVRGITEEVVNGEIRYMPAPSLNHARILQRMSRQIHLEHGRYRRPGIFAEGTLKPLHFSNVQIDIARIWPD